MASTPPGGIGLTIAWPGRTPLDFARVFQTAANIDDFRPPFKKIATEVVSPSIVANFQAGGRPSRWAALSPLTRARKSRQGSGGKILVHSGAMARAASDVSEYQIGKDEMRMAPFSTPYWVYHQVGTTRMPQRVIMMLQAADRSAITRIFADYIRTFMVFDPRKPGARVFTGGM